ncbi:hypothetical protein OIO90_006339 [Microbotryomycetes sp. JL221]|nr:hypothetical protein OIO90_006339 [Microbotryomycetes sp. JL221]
MSATTDQPAAMPTMVNSNEWRYYYYEPSHALAIATSAVFAAMFLAHLFLLFRTRAKYMWPFTLGALGEVIGYALRRVSADHPTGRGQGLIWYILQSLAIILSPALMAASLYMCFGRVITFVGEKYSYVRASRVTFIFVSFDVLSFIVQGAGGSLYSSDNRSIYPAAKAILIVGFLIQIIALGVFFFFAIIYQVRARKAGEGEGRWTLCLYTLYAGCIFILIRGIFRTIEFGSGEGGGRGVLLEKEAWYYGLETLPIVLCVLLFIPSHPGFYIPSDRSLRLHPEDVPTSTSSETTTNDEEKDIGTGHELSRSKRLLKKVGWY